MPDTRRGFLSSATVAAAAAGLAEVSSPVQLAAQAGQPLASKPLPPSGVQVPKVKFGKAEIGRLVCGCNTFYGYSHINQNMSVVMKEYFSKERVCDVLHRCNSFGINAFNYFPAPRAQEDLECFLAQGGKMNLVCQGVDDPFPMIKALKPLAVYRHGERTDRAFQQGSLDEVREWCKKVRDSGVMVGVGTHKPEVIATCEEQGWDVDFYAGCVYNRTRTDEELKALFHGETVEMPRECYVQSDPARMYKVLRATKKPCFAFKVMAAGRITNADQAFRTAFESIKPTDGVFIGLFPYYKDEVKENAARVQRLLGKA